MTDTKKLKASNRQAGRHIGGTVLIFLFLLVLGLFMALPIYLACVMSVKPVHELFIFPPKLYAIDPTLDNFRDMFTTLSEMWVPFSRYVCNSVLVTVSVTAASLQRAKHPAEDSSTSSLSFLCFTRAMSFTSCSILSWQSCT